MKFLLRNINIKVWLNELVDITKFKNKKNSTI